MNVSNIHRGLGAAMALMGLASADAAAQLQAKLSGTGAVPRQEADAIRFDGVGHNGPSGSPSLPKRTMRFVLPSGTDPKTVAVEIVDLQEETISVNKDLAPVPAIVSVAGPVWPAGARIRDGKDQSIYGKNAYYPASHIGDVRTARLGSFQIVEVDFHEYLYNPVARKLRRAVSGSVSVNSGKVARVAVAAAGASSSYDARMASELKGLVENFDQIGQDAATNRSVVAAAAANPVYAILTTDAIVGGSANLDEFAEAKKRAGFDVQIVTESRILRPGASGWECLHAGCGGGWGGGVGDAAAERLRGWLKANYAVKNIQHVLLVGNPDPVDGDVPMKMMWPRFAETDYRESPTDYYYSELTGNWDVDGDGIFGEERRDSNKDNVISSSEMEDEAPGGMERFTEVSVGRIPFYGSMADLDAILAKTVRYQDESDKSWRSRILVSQKAIDEGGYRDGSWSPFVPNIQMGEKIRREIAGPMGWGLWRIYDSAFGVSPDAHPTSESAVLDAWTAKDYGVHVWYTHGWSQGASGIFTSDNARFLDDAHPSFTFQGSCLTAYPEYADNLAYSLLKQGAIATIGATRVSWAYVPDDAEGSTSGSLGALGARYAKHMIQDTLSVGETLRRLRSSTDGWWMNMMDFNIYGDPSLTLGEAPASLPTVPRIVSAVPGNQTIRVTWKPVAKASSYNVLVKTGPGSSMTLSNIVDTTIELRGLQNGQPHAIFVAGANAEGVGAYSDSTVATPDGLVPPPAPASFSAVAGDAKVSLSWASATRATGYVVERATPTAQFSQIAVVTGLSYVDASVANGSKYYYRVSGRNSGGRGAVSATVEATPSSAPAEPCSPAISASNNTGNFNTTGKVCYKTTQNISGWGCANFQGRTVKVNGVVVACGGALPPKVNGANYFDVSAGAYTWASIYWW